MKEIRLEKVYLQRFSASDDGMHLEICQADEFGKPIDSEPDPLVTIRADTETQFKFVIYSDVGTISIPLEEIERSIAYAKQVVHSEGFYS